MANSSSSRYLKLVILSLGGSMVFNMAYLRYIFYDPLREALGLNHEQYGWTMGAFGLCAMLTYFPSGWLADRCSPRRLMTLSCVITGLIGFYFATFPAYYMSVLVHALWGVSTTLLFWASMMKACKDMAGSEEQGRFFGLLESGRGVVTTVANFICLALYSKFEGGSDPYAGLRWGIIFQSTVVLMIGVSIWCFFSDPTTERKANSSLTSDIVTTLKLPMVWAAAFMVFFCFGAKCLAGYANPYLTNVFGMSVTLAGTLAVAWNYGCWFLGGPIGGIIADKIGHRPKVLAICFGLMTIFFLPMVLTPGDPKYLLFLGITTTALFLSIFAIRGIYFAVIEDLNIPSHISGSTIGFMSLVGFTPDVFIYPAAGKILDTFPGLEGYRLLYWAAVGFGICGTLIAAVVTVKVSRFRASMQNAPNNGPGA